MVNISKLIDLRFAIIKAAKDANKKLTFEKLRKLVDTHTSLYTIEDYSHAIIDLAGYGILNVNFKKGLSPSCYKVVGNSIVSIWM